MASVMPPYRLRSSQHSDSRSCSRGVIQGDFCRPASRGAKRTCAENTCWVRAEHWHILTELVYLALVHRQILGDRVHAAALIGAENAAEGGQDIGADTDWVHSDEPPPTARGTGEPALHHAMCSTAVARSCAGFDHMLSALFQPAH